MANEYPATSIQGEADARFARDVAERTGGRIQIVHQYDAASGFRSKDMVEAIARGTVPIGNTYMGALGVQDDHDEDGNRLDAITEGDGRRGGGEQQDHDEALELGEEDSQGRPPAGFG